MRRGNSWGSLPLPRGLPCVELHPSSHQLGPAPLSLLKKNSPTPCHLLTLKRKCD
ncbi:hypothetical protein CHARACLAT_025671, partial [Characodon lateralis]|nr:hypothetical protein [Characodon lateralis]